MFSISSFVFEPFFSPINFIHETTFIISKILSLNNIFLYYLIFQLTPDDNVPALYSDDSGMRLYTFSLQMV